MLLPLYVVQLAVRAGEVLPEETTLKPAVRVLIDTYAEFAERVKRVGGARLVIEGDDGVFRAVEQPDAHTAELVGEERSGRGVWQVPLTEATGNLSERVMLAARI